MASGVRGRRHAIREVQTLDPKRGLVQVRGIKALERRFEITLKLVGSGRFITLRLLERATVATLRHARSAKATSPLFDCRRADFERWLRAVRSWEDEILVRCVEIVGAEDA